MRRLGKQLDENDLSQLQMLIGKTIRSIRCSDLSADLHEHSYASSLFQMPFFWNDKYGNIQSKNLEIQSEYFEDEESLIDYYDLKIKITEIDKRNIFSEDFNLETFVDKSSSSISFWDFLISEIQIWERNEDLEEGVRLNYDEGIMLVNNEGNRIFIASELKTLYQAEFIIDDKVIEKRVSELQIRVKIQ